MKQPYVGITGFMCRKEVEHCLRFIPADTDRIFMAGVLASQKTINGETNSKPRRYPRRENFASIFSDDPRVLNLIHFGTDNPAHPALYDDLMRCAEYAGESLGGFQINAVWPDARAIDKVKKQLPKARFVLQISPHLTGYSRETMTPSRLAIIWNRLYKALADDIIIDFSRGQGFKLPTDVFLEYAREFDHEHCLFGLTGAGGLSETNVVNVITPLAREFPRLSVDAENGLRTNGPDGGDLCLDRSGLYLERAFGIFKT
jgi:hypothetical protein